MIITIDGPTGTGKSTIAKRLAEKIGFIYCDTGAMYRCLTYGIIKHKINPDKIEEVEDFVSRFEFDIKLVKQTKHYFYENEDITEKIRGAEVTALVSKISAIPSVREKLVNLQRKLGKNANAVFEGRDLGSVVFPNAEIKIYLTAAAEVRAKRRYDEFLHKAPEDRPHETLEQALESLNKRDSYDSSREHSPLKQPENAHIIDTSNLTIEEILDIILEIKNKFQK